MPYPLRVRHGFCVGRRIGDLPRRKFYNNARQGTAGAAERLWVAAPGRNIMATEAVEGGKTETRPPMPGNRLRRLIFGSPYETSQAHHTRLPNALALPVFASDALSDPSRHP